jgi:hypothetical protein
VKQEVRQFVNSINRWNNAATALTVACFMGVSYQIVMSLLNSGSPWWCLILFGWLYAPLPVIGVKAWMRFGLAVSYSVMVIAILCFDVSGFRHIIGIVVATYTMLLVHYSRLSFGRSCLSISSVIALYSGAAWILLSSSFADFEPRKCEQK